ncbi:hypothetical protein H9X78_16845, partial [Clostridium saudiense]|nr:hypothetical protein [Clostridium saudiense]
LLPIASSSELYSSPFGTFILLSSKTFLVTTLFSIIKRGIKVEVLDRSENFISLKKCDKKEYVVQATKTSKDNYVTILIMENKVVTKKVLEDNNIKVPKGEEYSSLEEAIGK